MNNLDIYEAGRAVPNEAQKAFNNGRFSGTDINPMWRIKKLTELFGACGIGWYYDVISERAEVHGDVTIAVVDLNLYINMDGEWSKPIYGTGGNTIVTAKGAVSDEGYKMALTDALSVACKALGIGADVYFAKDKTKYTAAAAPQKKTAPPVPEQRDFRADMTEIMNAITGGDAKYIATGLHVWSDGAYTTIDQIPDSELQKYLAYAEEHYKKNHKGIPYAYERKENR